MHLIRVLIVEDEPIAASYLKKIVEKVKGMRVLATAATAEEALSVLANQSIDLIFMDVVIRGTRDGAELAVEVHRLYPQILILFLTAYSDEQIVKQAARAQAYGYLLKPYRPDEIRAALVLVRAALKTKREKEKILELIDGYQYDFPSKQLLREDIEVPLSLLENKLVALLARNHHTTIDSKTLAEMLEITDDALRALIYRVRKETSKNLIRSIKRLGYKIALK
jgi:DNA-binding response OmpR family regulator